MPTRLPTFYLSHGGGPWPYMTGPLRSNFVVLEASLKDLPQQLSVKPKAILVVSGHWEENDFAVMASPTPPMVYDFGGFPKELYQIRYSAFGSPELARQAHSLIQGAGLPTLLDPKRGFDHGTYSLLARRILKLMFPSFRSQSARTMILKHTCGSAERSLLFGMKES
jgi:aromatic ring-opening dioxygenase catalytic subunit (LigB family)